MRWPGSELQWNARECNRKNSDEKGPRHASGHQDSDQDEPERRENDFRIGDLSHGNKRCRVRDNHFGVTQSYEGDEKSDPSRGAVLQAVRNVVNDVLAYV